MQPPSRVAAGGVAGWWLVTTRWDCAPGSSGSGQGAIELCCVCSCVTCDKRACVLHLVGGYAHGPSGGRAGRPAPPNAIRTFKHVCINVCHTARMAVCFSQRACRPHHHDAAPLPCLRLSWTVGSKNNGSRKAAVQCLQDTRGAHATTPASTAAALPSLSCCHMRRHAAPCMTRSLQSSNPGRRAQHPTPRGCGRPTCALTILVMLMLQRARPNTATHTVPNVL